MQSGQGYIYNPVPPRVWSRVQNRCPSIFGATEAEAQQYKGNILQHRANSYQLSKSQVYSMIARGLWTNERRQYAAQTDRYSNPNVSWLERVDTVEYPPDNPMPGQPNNPAGPFAIVTTNPNGCDTAVVVDGGSLVCGTVANPCTGQLIKPNTGREPICTSTTASDVPGRPMLLCWDSTAPVYNPRQRYIMNTSTTGWPKNYKGFVSAMVPTPVKLEYNAVNQQLQWLYTYSDCLPLTTFRVFQNGQLVAVLPFPQTAYPYRATSTATTFTVVSYSSTIASAPSNAVTVKT